ncbi:hypothetical protein [Lysobacter gummosus]|uniref:hypothetical protein n=1 Tax=Lysobacter gummosus TaxID=262324 RepID=UPI003644DFC8
MEVDGLAGDGGFERGAVVGQGRQFDGHWRAPKVSRGLASGGRRGRRSAPGTMEFRAGRVGDAAKAYNSYSIPTFRCRTVKVGNKPSQEQYPCPLWNGSRPKSKPIRSSFS